MKFLLKVAISLTLIGVIVWQLGDLGEVGELMVRIDPLYVLLIIIVGTLDRVLMTFKWTQLLRSRGVLLPFADGMKIYCASMIWGTFLPVSTGADVIRAVSASRIGLDFNQIASSIIIERIVGFFTMLLLSMLGLFLLSQTVQLDGRFTLVWWGIFLLIFGATAVFSVSFSRLLFDVIYNRILVSFEWNRIIRRFRELHEVYLSYKLNKQALMIFFGLTVLEQPFSIVNAWLIAVGIGINVNFVFMAGTIPLSLLLARLPVSIEGIGVFEGIFIVLMSLGDISAAEAVSISMTARVLQILICFPWWFAHIVETGRLKVSKVTISEQKVE